MRRVGGSFTFRSAVFTSYCALLTDILQDRLRRLNARSGTLPKRALVMPISLDYTGVGYKSDDAVRINGHLDGETGPLVALCIPDKAYLGWVSEMIPIEKKDLKENFWRAASGMGGIVDGKMPTYRVTEERRAAAEMADWDALVSRLHAMYDEERPGSVVFLEKVLEWIIDADQALKELRRDKPEEDEDVEERDDEIGDD